MILIKLILYFAVLIGVLYLAYCTTRLLGKTAGIRQSSANMRVLEKTSLGKDSSLLIVKVQDKVLLLGVTPGGISKIQELSDYEEPEYKETADFGAVLAGQMKKNIHGLKKHKRQKRDEL